MKAEKRSEDSQQAIFDLKCYDQHKSLVAVIMNRFFLRYLNLLYREFEGDLVLPIVLGEIAHHNIHRFYSLRRGSVDVHEQVESNPRRIGHLDPTNAFSVSQATGIPRETVRRKIEKLEKRGWIVKNKRGEVFMSETVADHFMKDFNKGLLTELLATGDSLRKVLESD